ncbi:GIY-YIG nuclease family protein [Halomonas sp. 18H]|uniref:GIY-YIG nuclease family protein n=1 Tax=Halomonas almeriensis TaxID=308163 RepID=UPI002232761B|nr:MULTISPECIES: GIY-YIG nuclease family protein [Halomonas]MCW4149359.1 GIY-YIG nuclease family protein [Halomonas sp. 18H]MDN3553695.1 GIY-YIG nuclease family protein [Halomonas almeriensis]
MSELDVSGDHWHLYILETASGALYTGITTDVQRRFNEHQAGRGAKSLRGKGPLHLVYHQAVGEHGEALRLEAGIKRLSAREKRRWLQMRHDEP